MGDQYHILEMYKKEARLSFIKSEKAAAILHSNWNQRYILAGMYLKSRVCKKIRPSFVKLKAGDMIKPAFNGADSINILYCCSNSFAPYCGISIYSLLKNIRRGKKYDIIILNNGNISDFDLSEIYALIRRRKNVSIRFFDPSEYRISKEETPKSYFSWETMSRLYMFSDFFKCYDRMIYIDSDTIINCDISELYQTDLEGHSLGAVRDCCIEYLVNSGSSAVINNTCISFKYYINTFLGIEDSNSYFNAGVLLCDLNKMRDVISFEDICSQYGHNFLHFEQCLLNKVFYKDVFYLTLEWNVQNIKDVYGNCEDHISEETLNLLEQVIDNYKIMHYISPQKPWMNPCKPSSDTFISYASETIWYKMIIYAALTDKAEDFLKESSVSNHQ